MAGPLRRVSQNYNWTLKRANNDLHNSIIPKRLPAEDPSPSPESVISPWETARLQWKFKSEYDELRDHLERSVLILLSWWSTIKFLARAAVEHFIAQPEVASSFYKKGAKLLIHYILISVWGLLTALFGRAAPRVMFLPLSLFYHSANQKEHTSTNPAASPPARQYVLDDKPAQSLYVNRTARALPDVSAIITVLSDAIHSAVDGSVIDALKGGIDKLHSSAHIGEGRRFHNASFSHSHGDIGKPHEYANEIADLSDQ